MTARYTRRPVSACALSAAIVLAIAPSVHAGRVLFDAAHAEMAGNADWVIDSDAELSGDSNPARIPTPAQSGITASTSETYWKGGISAWGVTMVKHGNTVESLPRTGTITYGDTSNAQDLSHYKTFVICEPNTLFTVTEKTALINFVKEGGGLFIVSDHDVSDRNNDGVDSVDAWNDLFTNNGVQSNPFGIAAATGSPTSASNFSQVSTNINAAAPFKTGTEGTATNLEFNNGTSFTLSTAANASVKAAVWTNGSQTNTNVMMAYASYGLGRVVALGDSSPADDGTGDTGDSLFTGWSTGTNGVLIANATDWLNATPQTTYDLATGGSWANAAAWTGVVPDATTTIVDFRDALTGAATITLDKARSVSTLRFDSNRAYTIAGTAAITFGSSPINTISPGVVVTRGLHTIAAPLIMPSRGAFNITLASSTLTIGKLTTLTSGAGLAKSGLGKLQLQQISGGAILDVGAGTLQFIGTDRAATASRVNGLSVTSGATLDLGVSSLVIDYGSPAGVYLPTMMSYAAAGSLMTSASGLTIGYAEASDLGLTTFGGQDIDATAMLLRATTPGDSNLDFAVNFGDLVQLAQHYNTSGYWSDGDFDYSGTVDFADLVLLAQHYNSDLTAATIAGVPANFAADWALAQSLVPEPTTLVAALSVVTLATRRPR